MIVNKGKLRFGVPELLMVIISIIYVIGIRTWFAVCESTGDMVMSCHWAEAVLKVMSILFAVISICHIFIPDQRIKIGIDLPFFCICVLTAFVPGSVISLCMNAEMDCRQSMKLWTVILCIALMAVILGDLILYCSQIRGEKHHRKAD